METTLPLFDFVCASCEAKFEAIVKSGVDDTACRECGTGVATRVPSPFALFSTIVPSYPGCKKKKAGYVHSHGNRPKTPGKIQVGYGS